MTDTARPYPVRDPAPGPCVILDLPRLWAAVEAEMLRRGMTRKNGTPELKQLSDLVGLDRNTLGRARRAALNNKIVEGQRGGLNVNAYLTLVSFVNNGRAAAYGRELRGGVSPYTASIEPVPTNLDAPSDVTVFGDPDYRSGVIDASRTGGGNPVVDRIVDGTTLASALDNSAKGNVADLGDFTQYAAQVVADGGPTVRRLLDDHPTTVRMNAAADARIARDNEDVDIPMAARDSDGTNAAE